MILVTGATGFLGSELCRQLLEQGKKVRAIKRSDSVIPTLLLTLNIEWVEADILNFFSLEDSLTGIEQVYHCAALVSFDPADKKMMHRVNVEGTANIVNLCTENQIRLLHVSSVAAVGEGKENNLTTENDHWEFNQQQSAYAVSKYESEMEVWRGVAEGLEAVIVNPSIIIGKNAGSKGSGQLFEIVKNGLKFYPEGSSGLVGVADVAQCMVRLMESGIHSERFIINAENWLYQDLFAKIAFFYGLKPPYIKIRPWQFTIAWRTLSALTLLSGKKFPLTRETADSASKRQDYSNQKIKNSIDIDFTSIEEIISEICSFDSNAK